MGRALAAAVIALLCACDRQTEGPYLGYVEGESVHVASPVAGQLVALHAQRGQDIQEGAALFSLEAEREKAAVEEITHRLGQAQSLLSLAQSQLRRQRDLRSQKLASIEQLDAATTQAQTAQGRVDELSALLSEVRWTLTQKSVTAPAAGVVDDVYYRVGEQVAAGAPVLSLLPPQNRKLRFFVSQSDLARIPVGAKVSAHCDGCSSEFVATVRFVAPQAEFTPPVIYSESARQKLVFLVEAWPEADDALSLRPGQAVEVRLVQ